MKQIFPQIKFHKKPFVIKYGNRIKYYGFLDRNSHVCNVGGCITENKFPYIKGIHIYSPRYMPIQSIIHTFIHELAHAFYFIFVLKCSEENFEETRNADEMFADRIANKIIKYRIPNADKSDVKWLDEGMEL